MGGKSNRGATAMMTVAGLALLLALIGGAAFVTRTEPLVSELGAKSFVRGQPDLRDTPGQSR